MAMNIKSEEAHRLASEIARITGKSLTESVTEALREMRDRLELESRRARVVGLLAEIHESTRGWDIPDHAALLYDPETGLPK